MTQARMLQPDRPLNASIFPDVFDVLNVSDVPTSDNERQSAGNAIEPTAITSMGKSTQKSAQKSMGASPTPISSTWSAAAESVPLRDAVKQPEASLITTLDFAQLQPFQTIDHHFAALGVVFENAVALSPSNPAYPLRSGSLLVMDAPRSGLIEVKFLQPVQWVSVFVTSSRALSVFARDGQGHTIVRSGLTCANLADRDSAIPANQQLILTAPAMASLSFFAFDGCVAIGEFAFAVTHASPKSPPHPAHLR